MSETWYSLITAVKPRFRSSSLGMQIQPPALRVPKTSNMLTSKVYGVFWSILRGPGDTQGLSLDPNGRAEVPMLDDAALGQTRRSGGEDKIEHVARADGRRRRSLLFGQLGDAVGVHREDALYLSLPELLSAPRREHDTGTDTLDDLGRAEFGLLGVDRQHGATRLGDGIHCDDDPGGLLEAEGDNDARSHTELDQMVSQAVGAIPEALVGQRAIPRRHRVGAGVLDGLLIHEVMQEAVLVHWEVGIPPPHL